MRPTSLMRQLIFSLIVISFSGCGLFNARTETADKIIERASKQKIFFAPYDVVWKAAHSAIRYTIANENQDFGVIETDYIKTVDGWIPPFEKKPNHASGRYKLILNFAKGKTNGRDSTRVTIDKKIEVFKDFISETQNITSNGLEEQTIFYRIEREIIIDSALKKASNILE